MTEFTKLTPSYQGGEFAKPEHVIEVQEAFAPIESELADHEERVTAAEAVQVSQGRGLVAPNPGATRWIPPTKVTASAPTITLGTMNASPTISSPLVFNEDNPAFRYFGTEPVTVSLWRKFGTHTNYWAVDFMTDAPDIEISSQAQASGAGYRLIVDGEFVTADVQAGQTGGGGNYYLKVAFGSSKPRHVVIEMSNSFYFGGVYVAGSYMVWKSSTPIGPRVAFVGDSIVAGSTVNGLQAWPVECSRLLGWRDVQTAAVGGTGYLAVNPSANTFRDRISSFVSARTWADGSSGTPDVVIVAGGTNDAGAFTAAAIQAEAITFFNAIKANLPNAVLMVFSQYRQNGSPDQTTLDLRNAIQAAASAAGAHLFTDQIVATATGASTLGWITGTGKAGSTNGTGNADRYVGSDGTHPTLAGQQYLGSRAAQAIAAAMPILGGS